MVRQSLGDGKAMLGVLSGDVGQGRDLDARVDLEVFQGLAVVLGHILSVVRHDGGNDAFKVA